MDADEVDAVLENDNEENAAEITLSEERYAELHLAEQMLMTVTSKGFGKRVSSFEYRLTNRGGQGIINNRDSSRNGTVVAVGPVVDTQQIMMVTNAGQLIRIPVDGVRICSRSSLGVRLFRVADDEEIVSVAAIKESTDEEDLEAELEGAGTVDGTVIPTDETVAKPIDGTEDEE